MAIPATSSIASKAIIICIMTFGREHILAILKYLVTSVKKFAEENWWTMDVLKQK